MSTTNQKITALYCLLSQENMCDDESLSIENQKLILWKYADEHGFFNCKFYVDDGYSGASTDRPAYKEIMNDVEKERISTVIVKDQSRLGRDYLQTGLLMEITFPQYDVMFIAVNDGVDSINGEELLQLFVRPRYEQENSCSSASERRKRRADQYCNSIWIYEGIRQSETDHSRSKNRSDSQTNFRNLHKRDRYRKNLR